MVKGAVTLNSQTQYEIRFGLIALALSGLLFALGIILRGPIDSYSKRAIMDNRRGNEGMFTNKRLSMCFGKMRSSRFRSARPKFPSLSGKLGMGNVTNWVIKKET